MNPLKVNRKTLVKLTDLPNIGHRIANDLIKIGIKKPQDLKAKCPYNLYQKICEQTGFRHDPCLLDTFISIVSFIKGGEALPWWKFTEERKVNFDKKITLQICLKKSKGA